MADWLAKLARGLIDAGLDLTPADVADALWLAPHLKYRVTQWSPQPQPGPSGKGARPEAAKPPPPPAVDDEGNRRPPPPRPERRADLHVPVAGASGDPATGSLASTELRTPLPSALPASLELVKSLRPLLRRRPSRRRKVLDEARTVVRIVDEEFWDLVFRPAADRWLQVALVFDTGPSTDVWRPMYRELRAVLEQIGAFAHMRTWHWATERSPPELHPPLDRRPTARAPHRPLELIDPLGDQLVLVVTDCVSSSWHDGGVARILAQWASHSQVALLQVMPWHQWPRTGLRGAEPVFLSSRSPVIPNASLRASSASDVLDQPFGPRAGLADRGGGGSFVMIPVSTLEPAALNDLALVAAGVGGAQVDGFRLPVPATPAPEPAAMRGAVAPVAPREARRLDAAEARTRAEQLVREFWSSASAPACDLARYLAAAPVITLPVVRLIRHGFLGDRGRQIHEAEVMLGGLLCAVARTGPGTDPDQVEYEFHDEVRKVLLEVLGVADVQAVLRSISDVISRYVADHLGQTLDFKALLADPAGVARGPLLSPRTRIAGVTADILSRLGGEYERLVERLLERPADLPSLAGRSALIAHLSGLYFGRKSSGSSSAVAQFPGLLRRWVDGGQKPDAIVISGDITEHGSAEEFAQAAAWIDRELLPVLAPFSNENVIVVPGNHDLDTFRVDSPPRLQLLSLPQDVQVVTAFWQSEGHAVSTTLSPFLEFTSRYRRFDVANPDSWGVTFRSESGVRVGVARLCSSLFFGASSSRPIPVVGRLAAEAALSTLRDVDVRIAVMHDPLDHLPDFDRQDLTQILRAHECDVLLSDHSNALLRSTRVEPQGLAMLTAGGLGVRGGSASCQLIDLPADRAVARVTSYAWLRTSGWSPEARKSPQVFALGPTRPGQAASQPAKERVQAEWGLKRLGIPELWERGLTGNGVLVAQIGGLVDGTHPALVGALERVAFGSDSPELWPSDARRARLAGADTAQDADRYFTHTAGLIVGRSHAGRAIGAAPGARLHVFELPGDPHNPSQRSVASALLASLGTDVRVVCLTLGWREDAPTVADAVELLRRANILVVAAIGNEGPRTSRSPANRPAALSVGACGREDAVADFSSSQRFRRGEEPLVPSLVAPGVDSLSSVPDGGYERISGTSMSACYVAGLAALLFEAQSGATAEQVRAAILGSCVRPDGMSAERGNRGIPNGPRALAILRGEAQPPPAPSAPMSQAEALLHEPPFLELLEGAILTALPQSAQLERLRRALDAELDTTARAPRRRRRRRAPEVEE